MFIRAALLTAAILSPFIHAGAQVTAADSTKWGVPAARFVNTISAGNFADAAAMASPALPPNTISASALQQIWRNVQTQMGALKSLGLQRIQSRDTLHAVDFNATFEKSSVTLRVMLDDGARVMGMSFGPPAFSLPPYADSAAYREEQVAVGTEPWVLPGTLTIPRNVQRPPVVVLVHGSGPNDRDETLGPNKPFRDIALGLASRGIAVLRYDKRTFVHSTRMQASRVTLEDEVIDDALAAIAFARKQPGLDSSRVFVIGHSLGGVVLPEIAKRDGKLAGIILAAAPARPLADVMAEQLAYLDSLARRTPNYDSTSIRTLRAQVDSLRARQMRDSAMVMGVPAHYWYRLGQLDPLRVVKEQPSRVMVIQGGRDYQVTMQDFGMWQNALQGTPSAQLKAYPSLNHLFMTGTGRATPTEYQSMRGHVAPEVIADIVAWIARQ